MLCDRDINKICQDHDVVTPYDPELLQPASLDIRLGSSFAYYGNVIQYPADCYSFRLRAGEFMLGCSYETFKIPADLCLRIEGKSSWGRRGLMVHITAGFVDPGFCGQLTLELKNLSDHYLDLPIGGPIAQVSFHRMSGYPDKPYGHPSLNSHYQNQHGATMPYEAHH